MRWDGDSNHGVAVEASTLESSTRGHLPVRKDPLSARNRESFLPSLRSSPLGFSPDSHRVTVIMARIAVSLHISQAYKFRIGHAVAPLTRK